MTSPSDTQVREIRLPALSATMEEATLLSWKVSEGDEVREGQPIAEVSTDKVDMDIESPFTGTIESLLVEPGTVISLGGALATVATSDEDLLGGLDLIGGGESADDGGTTDTGDGGGDLPSPDDPDAKVTGAEPEIPDQPEIPQQDQGAGAPTGIVAASPPARKMARQLGIDLADVPATGARGQVTPADVKRFSESQSPVPEDEPTPRPAEAGTLPTAVAEEPPPAPAPRPAVAELPGESPEGEDPRRAAVRRATADVMSTSAVIPQFTLWRSLVLDGAARRKAGESWTTVFVRGLAQALREHPELNARWDEQRRETRPFSSVRVGLAIDRPGVGLMVATIDGPDIVPLDAADQAVRSVADRARTGKLRPEDMAQASITLSNLGGMGVDRFNALLFPPQAAILSAGTIAMRPVATRDGALKAALTCEVGLTVDHRVADGADGARFLDTLARVIEES